MKYELNDYHRNISDDELLEDIKRIANILGKSTLTSAEYKNNGGLYGCTTIARRFGGWTIALKKCNLIILNSQINNKGIEAEVLSSDIRKVARLLNKKTITCSEYSQNGKYSVDVCLRKFGSWNNALNAAGLVPFDHPLGGGTKNKVSEYACLEEIERLWIELGRQPTTTDIKDGKSKYSLHTYERRLGSWRKALEFFVDYMNGEKEIEEPVGPENEQSQPAQATTDTTRFMHKTKRDINLRMRFFILQRDSFKCCICGRSPATTPGLELQVDHIIPWSKGGETVIDNLQTLCSDCNLGKSNLF